MRADNQFCWYFVELVFLFFIITFSSLIIVAATVRHLVKVLRTAKPPDDSSICSPNTASLMYQSITTESFGPEQLFDWNIQIWDTRRELEIQRPFKGPFTIVLMSPQWSEIPKRAQTPNGSTCKINIITLGYKLYIYVVLEGLLLWGQNGLSKFRPDKTWKMCKPYEVCITFMTKTQVITVKFVFTFQTIYNNFPPAWDWTIAVLYQLRLVDIDIVCTQ